MISDKEIFQYLKRIAYNGCIDLNAITLKALHLSHLYNAPFENLDIHIGHKINISVDSVLNKVVLNHRGGFCYELNYAFSLLLLSLGFEVKLLSARVFNGNDYGKPFDHMLLLVQFQDEKMIADVGFGDSFREPLLLDKKSVWSFDASYKIKKDSNNYILYQKKDSQGWKPQYIFSLNPYEVNAFYEMCEYQQTSPESNFTKKSVCTIATESGRKTISNGKFIETTRDTRTENPINSETEYRNILRKHFQMELPGNVSLKKLLESKNLDSS